MPGEDGYSLINKVRGRRAGDGANIPAIELPAMARPEDSERAMSAGFQLHIPEPVDIDALSSAIAGLVWKAPIKQDTAEFGKCPG